jgi:hypothetical protein
MRKFIKRFSSITAFRESTPTSPELNDNFMNFRGNVTNQRNVRPRNWAGHGAWTTPNADGKAATFGTGTDLETGGHMSPANDPGATKV